MLNSLKQNSLKKNRQIKQQTERDASKVKQKFS